LKKTLAAGDVTVVVIRNVCITVIISFSGDRKKQRFAPAKAVAGLVSKGEACSGKKKVSCFDSLVKNLNCCYTIWKTLKFTR
jgi:hypothetical protein